MIPRNAKQAAIVESVRLHLEGEQAVDYVHRAGFALTPAGLARHLHAMGGRGRIQQLVAAGLANHEILAECLPAGEAPAPPPPRQAEMFEPAEPLPQLPHRAGDEMFETTRVSLRLPNDLYEALRLAARAEKTTQAQLMIDILTAALSRLPRSLPEEDETTGA